MVIRKLNHHELLQIKHCNKYLKANQSTINFSNFFKTKKALLVTGGLLATSTLGVFYALEKSVVKASGLKLKPPRYDWPHFGLISSFDVASLRRGYEVYKQICAACHSLKFVHYHDFVGTILTEEEAKAEAAEILVKDGPNAQGKMFERPGKLSDGLPKPYENEESARYANNGAYPPDLSYIILARKGNEDYIFSLLTGYCDAPAGITLQEGQSFNPYFSGGSISMSKALYNDALEYSDGTPATASQLAKDVTSFLSWASQFEHDTRKKYLIKTTIYASLLLLLSWIAKRNVWVSLKTRKIIKIKK